MNAACRYFERRLCNGCTRLHEPYQVQLERKQDHVRSVLEPVLGNSQSWLRKIVPSPRPMGYRASAKLCLHEDRYGKRAVGFYRQGSRDVVDIGTCPAQEDTVNQVARRLFAKGVRLPARLFNHQGRVFQRGRLKFLTIRAADGNVGIIVSHTGVEKRDIAAWLTRAGLGDVSAYESKLTQRDGDLVVGHYVDHVSGPTYMRHPLMGRSFEIAPTSFFQANYSLSESLIRGATSFRQAGDVLLDLYGGFGAYGFSVADKFKAIEIVDGNQAAIEAAKRFARTGSAGALAHVKATASMCERFLDESLVPEMAARVTHVIVNPPRGGLSRRVATTLGTERFPELRELHYVSCNPETLARDLAILTKQGLSLAEIEPYDMFPQTEHVEVVARLRRP